MTVQLIEKHLDVVLARIATAIGTLVVMAEVELADRALILRGLHIQGEDVGVNELGVVGVRHMVMSTKSSLKERLGPQVQIRDVVRVASGSPARFLLKSNVHTVKGPQAALALVKRHMPLQQAYAAVTRLFDEGEAIVDVPVVEDADALARDLAECNVVATVLQVDAAPAESK